MALSTNGGRDETISAINVTPLVDVVLVLLVILMVTATTLVSRTIPMDLPQAATGETSEAPLAISVDASGALFLDASPVTEEALRARLRERGAGAGELRAVLAADGALRHEQVVSVIDLLRSEGVHKLAIHVRQRASATGGEP